MFLSVSKVYSLLDFLFVIETVSPSYASLDHWNFLCRCPCLSTACATTLSFTILKLSLPPPKKCCIISYTLSPFLYNLIYFHSFFRDRGWQVLLINVMSSRKNIEISLMNTCYSSINKQTWLSFRNNTLLFLISSSIHKREFPP